MRTSPRRLRPTALLAAAALSVAATLHWRCPPVPAPGLSKGDGRWAAGYIATAAPGQPFREVLATFIVPTAPAPSVSTGWLMIWAGIGLRAHGDTRLLQAGVALQAARGRWNAIVPWWIDEPQTPTMPHTMALAVAPGQTVTVAIRRAARPQAHWAFTVTNQTTGQQKAAACFSCRSPALTAAWLVEDPLASDGGRLTAFAAPVRPVIFLNARAAQGDGPLRPLELGQPGSTLSAVARTASQGNGHTPTVITAPLLPPNRAGGFAVGRPQ